LVLRAFPPDRHEDEQELRRFAVLALIVGVVVALVLRSPWDTED
jgi:hypothetical protein